MVNKNPKLPKIFPALAKQQLVLQFLYYIFLSMTSVKQGVHISYATTILEDLVAFYYKRINSFNYISNIYCAFFFINMLMSTYLSINIIRAARANKTVKIIRHISGSSKIPQNGAKMANPNAPAAICIPTSPLPVDVSLVAITAAEANSVAAAAGKMSAIDLINKYNQKLTLLFMHSDSVKMLPVELYPL